VIPVGSSSGRGGLYLNGPMLRSASALTIQLRMTMKHENIPFIALALLTGQHVSAQQPRSSLVRRPGPASPGYVITMPSTGQMSSSDQAQGSRSSTTCRSVPVSASAPSTSLRECAIR
jgi:hypothetical protein